MGLQTLEEENGETFDGRAGDFLVARRVDATFDCTVVEIVDAVPLSAVDLEA